MANLFIYYCFLLECLIVIFCFYFLILQSRVRFIKYGEYRGFKRKGGCVLGYNIIVVARRH